MRRAEEELIVVAVQVAIEVRKLVGGEIGLDVDGGRAVVVVRVVLPVHDVFEAAQEGFQLVGAGFVGEEEVAAPVLDCFALFHFLLMAVWVGGGSLLLRGGSRGGAHFVVACGMPSLLLLLEKLEGYGPRLVSLQLCQI